MPYAICVNPDCGGLHGFRTTRGFQLKRERCHKCGGPLKQITHDELREKGFTEEQYNEAREYHLNPGRRRW